MGYGHFPDPLGIGRPGPKPSWEPLGSVLIAVGIVGAFAALALGSLSRIQATDVLAAIAALWWFGWPWYLSRRDHRLGILRSITATSPDGFEETVAELFRYRGYEHVHRVRSDPEEIRCLDQGGRSVLVRAIRLPPGRRVGSKTLKRFIREVRAHHAADRGIVVTSTTFTTPAFAMARRSGVGLMEGRQLVHALAAEDRDHHAFDRELHEWSDRSFPHARLVRVAVLVGLLTTLAAIWIGPVVRTLRSHEKAVPPFDTRDRVDDLSIQQLLSNSVGGYLSGCAG